MKKIIRIISLICLICVTATLLSSCVLLDEKKAQRAVWVDKGEDKTVLRYQKEDYYLLNNPYGHILSYGDSESIYTVDKDVPLLFTGIFESQYATLTDVGVIRAEYGYFARKDIHDEYTSVFNQEELSHYKVDYTVYNSDTLKHDRVLYVLDTDESEVITYTLKYGEKHSPASTNACTELTLDTCDSKGMIEGKRITLVKNNRTFKYGIYFRDSYSSNGSYIIYFSEDHKGVVSKLFKEYARQ